jgi:hypothetical protein
MDWIVREARLARDRSEAEKGVVIAGATSVWPSRGGRMAKAARDVARL